MDQPNQIVFFACIYQHFCNKRNKKEPNKIKTHLSLMPVKTVLSWATKIYFEQRGKRFKK